MERLTERLDQLGSAVRDVVDRSGDDHGLANVRRRLLAPSTPARRRRWVPGTAWAMAAAATAMVVVVGLLLRPDEQPPTSFEVGQPPEVGQVGAWVAADDEPTVLSFSEGSRVSLAAGTRARVTELTPLGATVVVERGTVEAAVVHRDDQTSWSVQAGPFTVQVVGTQFVATWNPDQETLRIAVREGQVLAAGPLLTPARRVSAGERLTVSVPQGRMALEKVPTSDETQAPAAPAEPPPAACAPSAQPRPAGAPPRAAAGGGRERGAAPEADAAVEPSPAATPSWRLLAAAGKHREAMALLEQEGFEQHLAGASADELRTLADVARFSGDNARAEQALLALRQRFGSGGSTAFLLGRIALARGSSAQAVGWFETYLQESPKGPLAEQALGRILDIRRHGDPETAHRAAKRYLARYPRGAYAALARSVLAR